MEFIAEIGSNYFHNDKRDLGRAKELISSAARSGAGIVKFQYFEADKLYNKELEPGIVAQLERIAVPSEWLPILKSECDANGVEFLCSVFHQSHISVLDEYVKRWKIASWELFEEPHINPLFVELAKTGKPIIMSSAGAAMDEIDWCLNCLVDRGVKMDEIILMHCDPGYPIALDEANLERLVQLAEHFHPIEVGYSSHIVNPIVVASSVLYFSKIIEVHYDLGDGKGLEASHSFSPQQFQEMIRVARMLNIARDGMPKNESKLIGQYRKSPTDWLRPLNRD